MTMQEMREARQIVNLLREIRQLQLTPAEVAAFMARIKEK